MLNSVASNNRQFRTILLAADQQNSIFAEQVEGQLNPVAYSAYGHQSASRPIATRLGFSGELSERMSGWYLLGNGYRAYNPTLMHFHSPDSLSPFGKGGFNAYMYCVGDPVNFTDPTGHVKLPRIFRRTRPRATLLQRPQTAAIPNDYVALPATSSSAARPSNTQLGQLPEIQTERRLTFSHQNSTSPRTSMPINAAPPRPPKKNVIPVNSKPNVANADESHRTAYNSVEPLPSTSSKPSTLLPDISSNSSKYAPVPPTRVLPSGASRQYSVTFDAHGNPTQDSVLKMSLDQIAGLVRNEKK